MSYLRSRYAPVLMVAVLCLGYVLSQFLRHSVGVITPELSADLDIAADGLGLLGAAYFIAFALMQVPVGLMLDSIGARKTMTGLLCVAGVGTVWFANAVSLEGIVAARALLGVGTAALLMGAFSVFAHWFAADRFATMVSIVMGVGYLGSVLATWPLGSAVGAVGWRAVFWVVTGYTVFLILVYALAVRDAPAGHPFHARPRPGLRKALAGLGPVLRNPNLPRVWIMQLVAYGTMASVLGLWAGHYFGNVHGLGAADRGAHLMVMALCATGGMFAFGPLDRLFNTRKWLVLAGAAVSAAILAIFALVPGIPLDVATILFGILAGANGYSAVLMAHCRAIFPLELVGRGITLTNMGNMGGVALLQYLGGAIIAWVAGPVEIVPEPAFRAMFGFLALALLFAMAVYATGPDIRPFPDRETMFSRIRRS